MAHDRSFLQNYFLYVGVIGAALMGIALGLPGAATIILAARLVAVTSDQETEPSQQTRTLLDSRMEDLREIRQALAKPLPSPAPLPRLTVRAAAHADRPFRHETRSKTAASQSTHHKLLAEARIVLEKIEPAAPDAQLSAYTEIDRHAFH